MFKKYSLGLDIKTGFFIVNNKTKELGTLHI